MLSRARMGWVAVAHGAGAAACAQAAACSVAAGQAALGWQVCAWPCVHVVGGAGAGGGAAVVGAAGSGGWLPCARVDAYTSHESLTHTMHPLSQNDNNDATANSWALAGCRCAGSCRSAAAAAVCPDQVVSMLTCAMGRRGMAGAHGTRGCAHVWVQYSVHGLRPGGERWSSGGVCAPPPPRWLAAAGQN